MSPRIARTVRARWALRCVVAIALVTGACSTGADRVAPAAASPERTTLAPTTSTTVPTLPPPQPWAPSAAEPVPNAKSLAARDIEAIGTYPAGAGTVPAALGGTRLPSLVRH